MGQPKPVLVTGQAVEVVEPVVRLLFGLKLSSRCISPTFMGTIHPGFIRLVFADFPTDWLPSPCNGFPVLLGGALLPRVPWTPIIGGLLTLTFRYRPPTFTTMDSAR